MRKTSIGLASGIVFGLGLVVSGMVDPQRVLGFLDVFGIWDPTLAFVMGGALITTFVGYRWVLRRPAPLAASSFQVPTRTDVDPRLVAGAVVFGTGWGLGGYCPGPALTALTIGGAPAVTFVVCMLAGMLLARRVQKGFMTGRPAQA